MTNQSKELLEWEKDTWIKWCEFNEKKLKGFIKSPTRMNLIFDFFNSTSLQSLTQPSTKEEKKKHKKWSVTWKRDKNTLMTQQLKEWGEIEKRFDELKVSDNRIFDIYNREQKDLFFEEMQRVKSFFHSELLSLLTRKSEEINHELQTKGITWKAGGKATPSQIEDIIVTAQAILLEKL